MAVGTGGGNGGTKTSHELNKRRRTGRDASEVNQEKSGEGKQSRRPGQQANNETKQNRKEKNQKQLGWGMKAKAEGRRNVRWGNMEFPEQRIEKKARNKMGDDKIMSNRKK